MQRIKTGITVEDVSLTITATSVATAAVTATPYIECAKICRHRLFHGSVIFSMTVTVTITVTVTATVT